MKFSRKIKPSRVLGDSKRNRHHPATHGALLREEDVELPILPSEQGQPTTEKHHVLYATNGYALVRIDVGAPDKEDQPGPIPAVALKHMERGISARLLESEVKVGKITTYERVYSEDNPGSANEFPDIATLEGKAPEPPDERKMTLTFSPGLLADIAAAMGEGTGLTLTFDADRFKDYEVGGGKYYSGGVRITPHSRQYVERATAVLMPIRPIGA